MLQNIFTQLDKIISRGGGLTEEWGNLTIDIDHYSELSEDVQKLSSDFIAYNNLLVPRINVDSISIEMDEIDDYSGSHFVIVINKANLKEVDDYHMQFFYTLDSFENWLKGIFPFSYRPYSKLKIIVNELHTTCGGPSLLITGQMTDPFDIQQHRLPPDSILHEHVSIPNGHDLSFNVEKNLITFVNKKKTKPKTNYSDISLVYSCASLCGTFVNELAGDYIVLQGVKRVKVPLYNDKTRVKLNFLFLLTEIVEWIYQDQDSSKIDIRRKLFVDRVTLDIDYEQPLLNELPRIAQNAFVQATERYNFVMLERRNDYAKELVALLKDLKAQSDLYSSKLRSLLGSLTRDVLAGILLIGFTLFTKFVEIEVLAKYEKLMSFIFKGLAIYFIASALMQMITDVSDIILSRKELNHWSKCTSEVIPKKELKGHVRKTLNPRFIVTSIIYFLLITLYGFIAYKTWNFPAFWNSIFN